jgi:FKBP-type peptidyl-prolyl cis-trans isomerase 2
MSGVRLGDEIAIHYRLDGPNGEVIAASGEGQPLVMRVGSDSVIVGLSAGVVGMQLEEIRAIHFSPEQAFGAGNESIERFIDKADLPPDVVIGDKIRLRHGDKCVTVWVVAEQWGTAWRVTTKHPCCGLNMAMTVKLVAHKG